MGHRSHDTQTDSPSQQQQQKQACLNAQYKPNLYILIQFVVDFFCIVQKQNNKSTQSRQEGEIYGSETPVKICIASCCQTDA